MLNKPAPIPLVDKPCTVETSGMLPDRVPIRTNCIHDAFKSESGTHTKKE